MTIEEIRGKKIAIHCPTEAEAERIWELTGAKKDRTMRFGIYGQDTNISAYTCYTFGDSNIYSKLAFEFIESNQITH